ncbi:MAG: hypothetical protein M1818_005675 [Claussenomyces sp. TS43310]|nr:MAG: hypothetical protein M1818_005675 [Claussenomyces sp. TS43310]
MSVAPKSPPETPIRNHIPEARSASPEGSSDNDKSPSGSSTYRTVDPISQFEADAPTSQSLPANNGQEGSFREQDLRQPEVEDPAEPSNPEELQPFDWIDFEERYLEAMRAADENEAQKLEQFDEIVKFFGEWVKGPSKHDGDRATKRLKTRQFYVQNAEKSLAEKQEHYAEVVAAFQRAVALLG